MQQYQSTPDYYRDYIEHGWVKDQAAKVHKYLKRWRNKAGKWVYEYKNDLEVKRARGGLPATGITRDIRSQKKNGYPINFKMDFSYGKPISRYVDSSGSRVNAGIGAGRKRAVKKGHTIKGYSGNLRDRGYSRAEGKYTKLVDKKGNLIEKVYGNSSSYSDRSRENKTMAEALKKRSSITKGINAGRQRVRKKKPKNLSQKGFSSSRN